MNKIGRNDPCHCGSGKKHKNCCLHTSNTSKDMNLHKIKSHGSEFYEIGELDVFDRFFIETTQDEKFEVKKIDNGYMIKDIVPPIVEMVAQDYKSIKFDDIQLQRIKKEQFHDQVEEFNGIAKGGQFSWLRQNERTCTKGKIDRLYVKQSFGNTLFNIHLFPLDSNFISIDLFLDKGLSITTENGIYNFESDDNSLVFEGCKVVSVLSLFDTDTVSLDDVMSLVSNNPLEHNVSFDIAIGKPFVVIRIQDDQVKMSVINENVIDVEGLILN